jgi:tRNA-Thr(GGU) m(6)t(6)A37 methyltransferase TsaA
MEVGRMLELEPIGWVRGGRIEAVDDGWGDVEAVIGLDPVHYAPDALTGLDGFSHVEVVYCFHLLDPAEIVLGTRRPRGNAEWPEVGIFAQRGRVRPNRLGVSTAEIVSVDGLEVRVRGLDAVDGTPVLDLKPHMSGFDPRGEVREPEWALEIMRDYWHRP